MTDLLFAVGNSLQGDDGAGPLLASLLEAEPAPGWEVIDGGATPENHTHQVRAFRPDRLLIVDAAEMGLAPGEIRRIEESRVAESFLVTTHAIPLNFLIASLQETIDDIQFLGIQPKQVAFMGPMSPEVRQAVASLHQDLCRGFAIEAYRSV
jgi:hydrogenase 3 maturation protease